MKRLLELGLMFEAEEGSQRSLTETLTNSHRHTNPRLESWVQFAQGENLGHTRPADTVEVRQLGSPVYHSVIQQQLELLGAVEHLKDARPSLRLHLPGTTPFSCLFEVDDEARLEVLV